MEDVGMKMKEDGVPCQAQEGFVGVHIGAGQHSEVMSERLVIDVSEVWDSHCSLFRQGPASTLRFALLLARPG